MISQCPAGRCVRSDDRAAADVAVKRSSAADAPGHPPDNPRCTPTPERDILAPNAGLRIGAAGWVNRN
jgi:hypothetical protein